MQYGLNINNSEEVKTEKSINKRLITKKELEIMILIFFGGILLGRANLLLNQSDVKGIAPFGLAYLMVIIKRSSKKNNLIAALGVCIGYFSINNFVIDDKKYLLTVFILTTYHMLLSCIKKRKREIICFSLILISFFAYDLLINKYEFGVTLTLGLIETLIIMPIYYVIKYAFDSLEEFNSNHIFISEELVSIGIFLCLAVSGVGNINIMDYSIRNVVALALVLGVAYIGGATNGAMIGVAMGIILGVASNDMMQCIGFFGVGGLIVGIFKDTGKIFSILSGILIYFALGVYSNALTLKFGIEVLAANVIFLAIPKSVYKRIEVEINPNIKKDFINDAQVKNIKEEFTLKVKELTSALTTISKCLEADNNENLLIKTQGSALVENLADRCCSRCENRPACWQRSFNQTFNSFQLLIKSYEEGHIELPAELERKCVKNITLLRDTEQVVNNYKANEIIKDRLIQGRNVLSEHVSNIVSTLDNLLSDFNKEVVIDAEAQKRIKRQLNKIGAKYYDVFCYADASGRMKIKIVIDSSQNIDEYNKNVVPMLSKMMRKRLCMSKDGSCINNDDKRYTITLEEAPKYKIMSYGANLPKGGESQTGDSYSFGNVANGYYATILSDGMGYGPQAGKESKATIDLVEKFMEVGFDDNTTINTLNSIMGMRFAEDEKYATLDLSRVDLYSGDTTFIKIGAAPTFIKRGNQVKSINSKNLPFGLIDEIDIEYLQGELKPGDMLINVSDGILDVDKSNSDKAQWLEEFLKNANDDPKTLSERIIERARALSNNEIKDDMTVLVSKIYINS